MASRPQRGALPKSYVDSDGDSREWHDYTKPIEIVSVDDPKLDIVFFHGLGSRWQQTWCSADDTTWIESLLPTEIPPARILVTGFNALRRIDGGLTHFSDGCTKLLEDLAAVRDDENRSIIFVGHSLGGLILQQALTGLPDSPLRNSIKGMLFFGTPQFEDDHNAWKEFRIQIGRMVDGNAAPKDIKQETLAKLGTINIKFQKWLSLQLFSPHVYRFYEGLPVYRIGMVVPQESCKIVNQDDQKISSDHLGIVKFSDPSDPYYQIVVKRIKHMYSYKDTSATSSFVMKSFSSNMDTQISTYSAFSAPTRSGTNDSQLSCPDAREEILKSNHTNVKLALALEDQGSYQEAENAYREAIEEFEETRGETDKLTLYCKDKLASLLRDRSRYEEAAKLAKEVLEARIKQYGLENSSTLSSAGSLALIMRYQNNQQEAFSMLRNALEANDTPPLTSITRTRIISVLAKIYRDHGAYDAAELFSRDVARACSLWLGEDHPFTLNRQSDLSVAYSTHSNVENRYLVAEDLSRQTLDALEKVLGRDHPNALRTSRRLGNYLRFEGDFENASKRLEITFNRQKEQVGYRHPSTLSTLTSFAAATALQGYVEEARRSLEDAHKNQEELLGSQHPNTLWTVEALEHIKTMESKSDDISGLTLDSKSAQFFQLPSQIKHKVSLDPVPVFWDSTHPMDRALIDAISSNSEQSVKDILNETTNQDILGRALRVAAYSGRDSIVRTLLERGAPINSIGGYYGTALQAAAAAGHRSTLSLLLEMNADVNIESGLLNTALRAAVFKGFTDIAKTLLDLGAEPILHGECTSPLQVAVGRKDTSMVQLLLERKADPNASDHLFGSPLQEASFHGSNDICILLISYGADPNLPGGLYGSAMQAALRASQRDTVRLLMDNGADASSYNMLNAILDSGMDLVDVSFGRHTSDLFVVEPQFGPKAEVSKLSFMRKTTLRERTRDAGGNVKSEHNEKMEKRVELTRKEEYTQRARSPIRPKDPKDKVKQQRDTSKTRKHFKILRR